MAAVGIPCSRQASMLYEHVSPSHGQREHCEERRHRQERKGDDRGRGAPLDRAGRHSRASGCHPAARRPTGYIAPHPRPCPHKYNNLPLLPMSAPDLPAPTPASEQSVYFDAPIMHFFSRNKPEDEKPADTAAVGDSPAAAEDNVAHEEPANRHSSVAIAPDPAVNRYHEHLDENEDDAAPEREARKPPGTKLSVGTNTEPRASSPPSDSGYGSSSPTAPTGVRPASRASRTSLKPVPVVWKDGHPEVDDEEFEAGGDHRARRAASMRSFRSSASRRDRDGYDHESIRSAPASRFSERRRRASLSGGSFAGGAGSIGPGATPRPDETESFVQRAKSAEAELTPKQKSKIEKVSGQL